MGRNACKIVVLGSTGSIGRNTLEVVAASQGRYQVMGLTAHGNTALLLEQARQFQPRWVVATDEARASGCDWTGLPRATELLVGPDGAAKIASDPEVETVVSAISGAAGLDGTWAALESGKRVALANKETLVMAGPLAMRLADERQAQILPVDSEHNAVFQAMEAGRRDDIARVILTASGGPFRTYSREQLDQVTVAEALKHPTWDMGPKITIDSATMMNKALEIVEARWLFDLRPDQIEVVVHPQSTVHSLVEYRDGSVLAQLSPPDMRLPIQYALSYPERWDGPAERLDISQPLQLDFLPPDEERFPALRLGHDVAQRGGTAGAVLNAANEAAVARFRQGEIRFPEITEVCRCVLENHEFDPDPTLDGLRQQDAWARKEVLRWN